jgi:sensor histidine kinase YesM
VSSLLANVTALLFRLNRLGHLRTIFGGSNLLRDYLAPLIVSLALLLVVRHYWVIKLMPSIYISLVQVVEVSITVLLVYTAVSILISGTMRRLIREMMGRVLNVILGA